MRQSTIDKQAREEKWVPLRQLALRALYERGKSVVDLGSVLQVCRANNYFNDTVTPSWEQMARVEKWIAEG